VGDWKKSRTHRGELKQRLAKETRTLFVCGDPPNQEMLHLMKGSTLIITPRVP